MPFFWSPIIKSGIQFRASGVSAASHFSLHASRHPLFPHIPEHQHPQHSRQRNCQDAAQQSKHFEKQITITVKLDYLVYLPEGYEQGDKKGSCASRSPSGIWNKLDVCQSFAPCVASASTR